MKRVKNILIMLPLLFFTLTVSAQDYGTEERNSSKFYDNLMVNMEFGVGLKSHDITPTSLDFLLGYRVIPKLAVFADYGGSLALYEKDNVRTYYKSQLLGGGLEYTFYNDKDCSFGLQGKIGTSIGNADWKQTVYDLKFVMRLKTGRKTNISFSLGYRHINSRTHGLDDINGLYGTIGIGI